jgi:hypothetical protein
VYGTGTGDVSKDVVRRIFTKEALSLEYLVRELSLDVTDTEATCERVGRYGESVSLEEREGEKEPGTEDSLGVGLTIRVVPTECTASVSGSWK